MVVTLPSLSDITGPYFLDSLARERCGLDPKSKMLPMIGNGYGPGGSLDDLRALEFDSRIFQHNHTMGKIMSVSVGKFMICVSFFD